MVKKPRMVRTFARTAPKSQEKYLVDNAKKLYEDPFLIFPDCSHDSDEKYFKKLKKQIEKVYRFRDDEEKLEKLANKKGLDGAFAGTLLLARSGKAPYLGVIKFSTGDVTYAQRGKADKEKLLAVQHFDNPIFRLLAIKDLVAKKNLHMYSWDTGYVCTGRQGKPPKEFLDFLQTELGFTNNNDTIVCPHITPEQARNKEYLPRDYLRIYWKSASLSIALCESCTKTTKNTMFTLSKYLLQRNLSDDFDIDVITQVGKHSEAQTISKTKFLSEYLSGRITDSEFIKKNAKTHTEQVQQGSEKIFILNGESYGTDSARFINAIQPNTYEKPALEFILDKVQEPLIVTNTTPNKILEKYWEQYGKDYLLSKVDDPTMVDSFFHLDDTPSNIVQLVDEYQQRQTILTQLPRYDRLPPLASFIDSVARTYKTFGEKNALLMIKKRPETPKGKSLAYAFLLAFGKGTDTKWQYSKEEIEYGEFLQALTRKLLDAEPNHYHQVFQELLTASGSSETLISQ